MTQATDPFNVYGYARKSTSKQYLSLDAQQTKIDKYYPWRFDDDPLATWGGCYEDDEVSAVGIPFCERPKGRELNLKVRQGDHILLALGDRAFRSAADCCVCIKDWTERGVAVHYVNTGGLDTSTSVGRLVAQILASLGEFEGELRSERQRARNEAARAKGLPTNGHAAWGWKIIGEKETRRYVEAPEDRMVANLAAHRVDTDGWSLAEVVEQFNGDRVKARHYDGHSKKKLWTVHAIFQSVKAARADFLPDPRVGSQGTASGSSGGCPSGVAMIGATLWCRAIPRASGSPMRS